MPDRGAFLLPCMPKITAATDKACPTASACTDKRPPNRNEGKSGNSCMHQMSRMLIAF